MSELDPESRDLFRAGRDALRPSVDDRARIREALRARITGVSQAPDPTPLTSAGSGLGWLSVSALVAAVVVGGVLLTPKASAPQAPAVASASPPARSAEAPTLPPPTALAPAPPPSSAPPSTPATPAVRSSAKPRPTDSLAEEVALLSRAQTELHAGRFSAALQLLNTHQKKFPRGILGQERVAARIQALCGLGRVNEANAELARVAKGSLHEGAVREACGRKAAK